MRVLITGASRGIGFACASAFARQGADVALCATHHDRLSGAMEAVRKLGGRPFAIGGDLTDADVAERLVAAAVAEFGGLDAVVSNAGLRSPGLLTELKIADWDAVFGVNLRATWLLARAAYIHLRESRGSFVAVGSIAGRRPSPGTGAYSASKAAVSMLVRQLAQEWAASGIRANCVVPGYIATRAVEIGTKAQEIRERLIPVGRLGNANEVASVVEFLVSDRAAYVTGQEVVIDGGYGDALFSLAHYQERGY